MKHLPKQAQQFSIKLSFKRAIRKVFPKVKLDRRKKYSDKLLIKLYITKRNGSGITKNTRKRARDEEEIFSPRKRFKSSRDKQKGRAQRYSPEVVVIDDSSEDAEDEYESDSEEEETNNRNEEEVNRKNDQEGHPKDKEEEPNHNVEKQEATREDDDDDKTVVGETDEDSSGEEEWFFQERRTDEYTDDEEQFYRERGTDEYTDDDWAYDPRYQYGELVTLYTMSPSQNI